MVAGAAVLVVFLLVLLSDITQSAPQSDTKGSPTYACRDGHCAEDTHLFKLAQLRTWSSEGRQRPLVALQKPIRMVARRRLVVAHAWGPAYAHDVPCADAVGISVGLCRSLSSVFRPFCRRRCHSADKASK